jgi:hypothetical protein
LPPARGRRALHAPEICSEPPRETDSTSLASSFQRTSPWVTISAERWSSDQLMVETDEPSAELE